MDQDVPDNDVPRAHHDMGGAAKYICEKVDLAPHALTAFDKEVDALRQILGHGNFTRALEQIQRQYGGGSIAEPQLEAAFARWLPNRSAACTSRLSQFFRQWWDTAYPKGGGANRPRITGPGLAGPGFYTGGCTRT